jgi:hypothetical protein
MRCHSRWLPAVAAEVEVERFGVTLGATCFPAFACRPRRARSTGQQVTVAAHIEQCTGTDF